MPLICRGLIWLRTMIYIAFPRTCSAEAGIVSLLVSPVIKPHLCAVFGCSHNSKREKGKFQIFRFPSVLLYQGEETRKLREERRRQWLANINRVDLDAKADHSRVCSNHFISGKTILNAKN